MRAKSRCGPYAGPTAAMRPRPSDQAKPSFPSAFIRADAKLTPTVGGSMLFSGQRVRNPRVGAALVRCGPSGSVEGGEPPREIGLQVLDVFQPDMDTQC